MPNGLISPRGALVQTLGAVLGIVFALCVGYYSTCNWADARRWASGLLELAGLVLVAIGIAKTRAEFNLPSFRRELWAEVRAVPGTVWQAVKRLFGQEERKPPITGSGSGAVAHTSTGRGIVGPAPGMSLVARVARLERLADESFEAHGELTDDMEREAAERGEADKKERSDREADVVALRASLRNVAVGDIHYEAIGLGWLVVGVALATWSWTF